MGVTFHKDYWKILDQPVDTSTLKQYANPVEETKDTGGDRALKITTFSIGKDVFSVSRGENGLLDLASDTVGLTRQFRLPDYIKTIVGDYDADGDRDIILQGEDSAIVVENQAQHKELETHDWKKRLDAWWQKEGWWGLWDYVVWNEFENLSVQDQQAIADQIVNSQKMNFVLNQSGLLRYSERLLNLPGMHRRDEALVQYVKNAGSHTTGVWKAADAIKDADQKKEAVDTAFSKMPIQDVRPVHLMGLDEADRVAFIEENLKRFSLADIEFEGLITDQSVRQGLITRKQHSIIFEGDYYSSQRFVKALTPSPENDVVLKQLLAKSPRDERVSFTAIFRLSNLEDQKTALMQLAQITTYPASSFLDLREFKQLPPDLKQAFWAVLAGRDDYRGQVFAIGQLHQGPAEKDRAYQAIIAKGQPFKRLQAARALENAADRQAALMSLVLNDQIPADSWGNFFASLSAEQCRQPLCQEKLLAFLKSEDGVAFAMRLTSSLTDPSDRQDVYRAVVKSSFDKIRMHERLKAFSQLPVAERQEGVLELLTVDDSWFPSAYLAEAYPVIEQLMQEGVRDSRLWIGMRRWLNAANRGSGSRLSDYHKASMKNWMQMYVTGE